MPVVSRYFVAYLASFMAIAPFFRSKDERVQTGTEKFFHKALNNLAGLDDTALSVYLNCKATAWYRQFPPVHSPDRTEDPKMPKVAGGNEEGKQPEDEDDVAERPVASESSEDEAEGGRQE